MMTDNLDDIFAAARGAAAAPSPEFMARMLALAQAEQPAPVRAAQPVRAVKPKGLLQGLVALFGVPALGGMVTAAATGLWIGVAGLGTTLPGLAGEALGTVTLVPTDGFDMLNEALLGAGSDPNG